MNGTRPKFDSSVASLPRYKPESKAKAKAKTLQSPMSSFCEGILTQTPVHVGCAQNVYAFMGVWA